MRVPSEFSITGVPHRLLSRLPPLHLSQSKLSPEEETTHLTASEWQYAMIRSSPPIDLRNLRAAGIVMYGVQSCVPVHPYYGIPQCLPSRDRVI